MVCFHRAVWRDVLVFNFSIKGYLLQGKKCIKCGKTWFRHARAGGSDTPACSILTVEALKKAELWDEE